MLIHHYMYFDDICGQRSLHIPSRKDFLLQQLYLARSLEPNWPSLHCTQTDLRYILMILTHIHHCLWSSASQQQVPMRSPDQVDELRGLTKPNIAATFPFYAGIANVKLWLGARSSSPIQPTDWWDWVNAEGCVALPGENKPLNWAKDEPNAHENEICMEMQAESGSWNNFYCGASDRGVVIEYETSQALPGVAVHGLRPDDCNSLTATSLVCKCPDGKPWFVADRALIAEGSSVVIQCPRGADCTVFCEADVSCKSWVVSAQISNKVTVYCQGRRSCSGLVFGGGDHNNQVGCFGPASCKSIRFVGGEGDDTLLCEGDPTELACTGNPHDGFGLFNGGGGFDRMICSPTGVSSCRFF